MNLQKAKNNLDNALIKITKAQSDVWEIGGGPDNFYATCCLTIAKEKIREAIKHIQKITPYNEGGDEDEKDEQVRGDS